MTIRVNLPGIAVVRSRTELPVVPRFRTLGNVWAAHWASEHHATAAEERSASCKARPRRLRLVDKRFSRLFGALLEVLTGLDDDRRISILNLNVVHLSKSAPGPAIDDSWKFYFHDLLAT